MRAGKLKIKWRYVERTNMPPLTFCGIIREDDPTKITRAGVAVCASSDHFCKETGRKLSLARALKNANLPKEERAVIWELYRNSKPGKRW